MIKLLAAFLIAVTLLFSNQAIAETEYQRAVNLYQQVMSGQIKFEELSARDQQLVIAIHKASSNSSNKIEGYDFTLRDIERKCEAYKHSENYGDIECRGSDLRIVEKKCKAYFSDPQNGEIDCRGSEFRIIERKCSISMYSENYGDIDC